MGPAHSHSPSSRMLPGPPPTPSRTLRRPPPARWLSTTSAHSHLFLVAPMVLAVKATHTGFFFFNGQNIHNKKSTILNIIKCIVRWH